MTGTDILSTLNTPAAGLPQTGASYKPLKNNSTDENGSDFTMLMTAKISTSMQEISAKQTGGAVTVTASSRTVRTEVFSISTNAKGASLSNAKDAAASVSTPDSSRAAGDKTVSLSQNDLNKVSKALDDFKTGVNDVLKKELGVTDEDIKDAMETLGLSYLDLTDTNKLGQLMMQLLGNDFDAASLLSLQNFSDIKNSINDLAQNLFAATGLSASQLSAVDEMLTKADANGIDISDMTPADGNELNLDLSNQNANTDKVATDVNTARTAGTGAEAGMTADVISTNTSENPAADPLNSAQVSASPADRTEITPETAGQTDPAAADAADPTQILTDDTREAAEETAETPVPAVEAETDDTPDTLSDLTDDTFAATKNMGAGNTVKAASSQNAQNPGTQTGTNENHNNAFNLNQPNPAPAAEMRAETAEVPVSYTTATSVDTRDILSQMASGIRTAVTERATTMELNLNPENLGRMSIKVTSEEGQVTAHVTLENENVRSAMETQMGVLKANLEAQGIKVNEVTVTADAHQFERNLEEGQAADMTGAESNQNGAFRNEEEERRHTGGRLGNIDMRSLDADGLENLSEDERLAAQIMKDNGNTISINA